MDYMENNFIMIDGPDGCGKTALINRLKQDYPEYIYVREPGDLRIAENQKIRDKFLSTEMSSLERSFYMIQDRKNLLNHLIQNEENKTVIFDRCFISTLVYQRNHFLSLSHLTTLHHISDYFQMLLPSLSAIYILSVTPEERLKRMSQRSAENDVIERKGNDYFERIIHYYDTVQKDLSHLGYNDIANKIHYINANNDCDTVYMDFINALSLYTFKQLIK